MVTNFTLDKGISELINKLHEKTLISKSKLIRTLVLTSLNPSQDLPQIVKMLRQDEEIKNLIHKLQN